MPLIKKINYNKIVITHNLGSTAEVVYDNEKINYIDLHPTQTSFLRVSNTEELIKLHHIILEVFNVIEKLDDNAFKGPMLKPYVEKE